MPLLKENLIKPLCDSIGRKTLLGLKLMLQIVLLVMFFEYFGLPAIHKYHKKDVVIVKTVKDTNGIPLPGISLAFTYDAPEIQKHRSCYNLNVSIEDCLHTNAPDISMILKKTMLGYTKKERIIWGKDNFTSTLDDNRAGLVFTLTFPLSIGPDDNESEFFLFLKPTFCSVMLHDPNFFTYNDNPFGIPTATERFDAGTMFSYYRRLALTEMEELNIPKDLCNKDIGYNFNFCVRKSLAQQVTTSQDQMIMF